MKAVTPGDEVAPNLAVGIVLAKSYSRLFRFQIVNTDTGNLKLERFSGAATRRNQIFDDFVLAIHRDPPACQRRHVNATAFSEHVEIDAVVEHALALEPRTHTVLHHELDRRLFQNSCADALDHVILGTIFDDDGIDSCQVNRWPSIRPAGPAPTIPT